MKAYLDSTAVIDLLDSASVRHQQAIKTLEVQPRTWCTSDLVRLECLTRPMKQKDNEAERTVREVLSTMEMLPMSSLVFDTAAALRAEFGLRTPDALHLATAVINGCDEFWTNDEKLLKASANIQLRQFT